MKRKLTRVDVADDRLIRRERYNSNDFEVVWHLDKAQIAYVKASGISLGPAMIRHKPKTFEIFNHAFYIPEAPKSLFNMVEKFGSDIGNGETRPSNPAGKPGLTLM